MNKDAVLSCLVFTMVFIFLMLCAFASQAHASDIPRYEITRSWRGIVVHHSATETGTVASIRNYHVNHNGP